MGTHSIHIILDDDEYNLLLEHKVYKSWKDFILGLVKNGDICNGKI